MLLLYKVTEFGGGMAGVWICFIFTGMNKQEHRERLVNLLNKIQPGIPETEMVALLQEVVTTVGSMRYRLRDMPLISGALNLLISSAVLDYEEKEVGSYEGSVELKTIVDLVLE